LSILARFLGLLAKCAAF